MDKIRCPNCRGAKKVAKLGGMLGDCALCNATGTIPLADKPKPVITVVETQKEVQDIIAQVSSAVEQTKEVDIKINPKKAVYRKKKESTQTK